MYVWSDAIDLTIGARSLETVVVVLKSFLSDVGSNEMRLEMKMDC